MQTSDAIQSGWADKARRGGIFHLYDRRYLMLTPNCLHYFHSEPSDDVMFVKGTDTPLTRKSIELSRISQIDIVGKRSENKQKMKITVQPAPVKGKQDTSQKAQEEYIFRIVNQSGEVAEWKENIWKARNEYMEKMTQKADTTAGAGAAPGARSGAQQPRQ